MDMMLSLHAGFVGLAPRQPGKDLKMGACDADETSTCAPMSRQVSPDDDTDVDASDLRKAEPDDDSDWEEPARARIARCARRVALGDRLAPPGEDDWEEPARARIAALARRAALGDRAPAAGAALASGALACAEREEQFSDDEDCVRRIKFCARRVAGSRRRGPD